MSVPFRKKLNLTANSAETLLNLMIAAGYKGLGMADEYRIINGATAISIGTEVLGMNTTDFDQIAASGTDTERAAKTSIDLSKIVLMAAADCSFYIRVRGL